MGTIHNLAARFKALDFELIKQQSLIETAPGIIPQMTEDQMRYGYDSRQQLIGQLQSPAYALDKVEWGGSAAPGQVDLHLTGKIYAGLRTSISPTTIDTYSIDFKAPKLEDEYGNRIYGANKANLTKYAIEDLKPVLMQKLKENTVG